VILGGIPFGISPSNTLPNLKNNLQKMEKAGQRVHNKFIHRTSILSLQMPLSLKELTCFRTVKTVYVLPILRTRDTEILREAAAGGQANEKTQGLRLF